MNLLLNLAIIIAIVYSAICYIITFIGAIIGFNPKIKVTVTQIIITSIIIILAPITLPMMIFDIFKFNK